MCTQFALYYLRSVYSDISKSNKLAATQNAKILCTLSFRKNEYWKRIWYYGFKMGTVQEFCCSKESRKLSKNDQIRENDERCNEQQYILRKVWKLKSILGYIPQTQFSINEITSFNNNNDTREACLVRKQWCQLALPATQYWTANIVK